MKEIIIYLSIIFFSFFATYKMGRNDEKNKMKQRQLEEENKSIKENVKFEKKLRRIPHASLLKFLRKK